MYSVQYYQHSCHPGRMAPTRVLRAKTFLFREATWNSLFKKKPNIMVRHNVIYLNVLYARDIPMGLACTRHGFDTSISFANQV